MRKPNDTTLKDAIQKMLKTYKLTSKIEETTIINAWPELMGMAVSNRTTQLYIHNKKLFVRIESSVIKNELLMVKSGIIEKLNERAGGGEVINEIVFL